MYTKIKDSLGVDLFVKPRRNKAGTHYFICSYFRIMDEGQLYAEYYITTGLMCEKHEWKKGGGEVKGKTESAAMFNSKILEYKPEANKLIQRIALTDFSTPAELFNEIQNNARKEIVGKRAKGISKNALSRLQANSYGRVMWNLIEDGELAIDRRRNYERGELNLDEYFKGNKRPV